VLVTVAVWNTFISFGRRLVMAIVPTFGKIEPPRPGILIDR